MRKLATILFLMMIVLSSSLSAQFTTIVNPVTGGLPFAQLQDGDAAWGDYDADGDLDFVINGRDASFINRIYIYANNGDGSFSIADSDTLFGTMLEGLYNAGVAWGDFDNDGDLDLIQNGIDAVSARKTLLYENTDGGFNLISNPVNGTEPFIGSSRFNPTWVDFNNDGKLDVYISGTPTSIGGLFNHNKLYQGNGDGTFVPVDTPVEQDGYLDGYRNGSGVWGDINNDGYMDLFSQGENGFQGINSTLYSGKGDSTFSLLFRGNTSGSPILTSGGGRFGGTIMIDYDNDGDLDLYFSGESKGGGRFAALYSNDGNNSYSFVSNIGGGFRGFTGILGFGVSWGDFDGDGDSDLAYGGAASTSSFVDIEENKGNNIFEELFNPLDGTSDFDAITPNSLEFGDYDNDGDLDLLANGGQEDVILYQNTLNHSNARPGAPANLSMTRTPDGVTLSWDPSTDDMTTSSGLSYELRVGTASGSFDVVAPNAITSGENVGKRTLQQRGNIQGNWAKLKLPLGTYFWSVQAIDPGHNGSLFATEGTFVVEEYVPAPPSDFTLLYPANNSDTLTTTPSWFSWGRATDDIDDSDSLKYVFELSNDATFSTKLDSVTVTGDTSFVSLVNLEVGEYFWRVAVSNSNGLTTWGSGSNTTPFSFQVVEPVSNEEDEQANPLAFKLSQNYPNPFNPSTNITYSISSASDVTVEVFTVLGQKVATLINTKQSAGVYTINFDASSLTSGIYLYRIKAGAFTETKRMTILK